MELWHAWLSLLSQALNTLSTQFGFSEAMAIVALALLSRAVLLPLGVAQAVRAQRMRAAMKSLQPEIEQLKGAHKDDAAALGRATMALYRSRGIKLLDRLTLANLGGQGLLGAGCFEMLRAGGFQSRFLWIASLAKPDLLLAAGAALLAALAMLVAPESGQQAMLFAVAAVALVSLFTLAAMPASVGLYWAGSGAMSVLQALIVRQRIARAGARSPIAG